MSELEKPSAIGRWFTNSWTCLNDQTIGTDAYWSIALQNAAHFEDMKPLLEEFVQGRVLDMGAGRLAWRSTLSSFSGRYISGDVTIEHPGLDVVFDVTHPWPFEDACFDTIFSCSVLEHIPSTGTCLTEMHRVLVPGGVAIVSVPFMFYLHGQPHDYWRFTSYGLVWLAETAGFKVERLVANGGLFSFLLNIPSVAVSSMLQALHLVALVPAATAGFHGLARRMDNVFDPKSLFASNHICVLRKPEVE